MAPPALRGSTDPPPLQQWRMRPWPRPRVSSPPRQQRSRCSSCSRASTTMSSRCQTSSTPCTVRWQQPPQPAVALLCRGCKGHTQAVVAQTQPGTHCRSALCRGGPAPPPRDCSAATGAALVGAVTLPVALDGLKHLFLNCVRGQAWISVCPAHGGPGEAIGLCTTVWCSVRDEVCAATGTAPHSHGASGLSVPAASPPVVSPACGQAAAGLWTGGTQGEGGRRCSVFLLKRNGLLC